jgi:hypothetical protein
MSKVARKDKDDKMREDDDDDEEEEDEEEEEEEDEEEEEEEDEEDEDDEEDEEDEDEEDDSDEDEEEDDDDDEDDIAKLKKSAGHKKKKPAATAAAKTPSKSKTADEKEAAKAERAAAREAKLKEKEAEKAARDAEKAARDAERAAKKKEADEKRAAERAKKEEERKAKKAAAAAVGGDDAAAAAANDGSSTASGGGRKGALTLGPATQILVSKITGDFVGAALTRFDFKHTGEEGVVNTFENGVVVSVDGNLKAMYEIEACLHVALKSGSDHIRMRRLVIAGDANKLHAAAAMTSEEKRIQHRVLCRTNDFEIVNRADFHRLVPYIRDASDPDAPYVGDDWWAVLILNLSKPHKKKKQQPAAAASADHPMDPMPAAGAAAAAAATASADAAAGEGSTAAAEAAADDKPRTRAPKTKKVKFDALVDTSQYQLVTPSMEFVSKQRKCDFLRDRGVNLKNIHAIPNNDAMFAVEKNGTVTAIDLVYPPSIVVALARRDVPAPVIEARRSCVATQRRKKDEDDDVEMAHPYEVAPASQAPAVAATPVSHKRKVPTADRNATDDGDGADAEEPKKMKKKEDEPAKKKQRQHRDDDVAESDADKKKKKQKQQLPQQRKKDKELPKKKDHHKKVKPAEEEPKKKQQQHQQQQQTDDSKDAPAATAASSSAAQALAPLAAPAAPPATPGRPQGGAPLQPATPAAAPATPAAPAVPAPVQVGNAACIGIRLMVASGKRNIVEAVEATFGTVTKLVTGKSELSNIRPESVQRKLYDVLCNNAATEADRMAVLKLAKAAAADIIRADPNDWKGKPMDIPDGFLDKLARDEV